ncbi:hypothetical protein PR202_ga20240 [Eleusine coracana subsp. coracana]|uniref:Pentatricopeptide repeat-containing protein n=1 Tax=Eleusine coracana subsp. coracana TaxID=191504 RepID=A0AAV5CWL0_ELECO|nr:hypothetical protein PR202_ga20240 [Eleusine coracana subsp. coracana]
MVDLLARGGRLQDAYSFALDMPPHAINANAWGSLLSACKVHGEIEISQLAADHLFFDRGGGHREFTLLCQTSMQQMRNGRVLSMSEN